MSLSRPVYRRPMLKVHHLDCASMCPLVRPLVNGDGRWLSRGSMCAHCLLIETPGSGLVLVDTGVGAADLRDPRGRLGAGFTFVTGLRRDTTTAADHVRRLGFSPADVRHVVVTHLDLDHAGGLPDFPDATVHVHADERDAAEHPRGMERERYRPCHFSHGPRWRTWRADGEAWRGFGCVRDLPGLPPELLLIPLAGHTRGHACVAVDAGERWLLHCGDGFFHRSVVSPEEGPAPAGLTGFERLVAVDYPAVQANHRRLRALAASHPSDLRVFCAHDPEQLRALAT